MRNACNTVSNTWCCADEPTRGVLRRVLATNEYSLNLEKNPPGTREYLGLFFMYGVECGILNAIQIKYVVVRRSIVKSIKKISVCVFL